MLIIRLCKEYIKYRFWHPCLCVCFQFGSSGPNITLKFLANFKRSCAFSPYTRRVVPSLTSRCERPVASPNKVTVQKQQTLFYPLCVCTLAEAKSVLNKCFLNFENEDVTCCFCAYTQKSPALCALALNNIV